MYTINGREVFWDTALIDKSSGITIKNHTPSRKNIIINLDKPWEGEHGGYLSFVKVGDTFRIYYRGAGNNGGAGLYDNGYHSLYCVIESKDGKSFTRPNLGIFEFEGSRDNNIVFMTEKNVDNFSVYYDENPGCPEDEKFKALSSTVPTGEAFGKLGYYKSADGYRFTFVKSLPFDGAFDSLNLALWDNTIGKYRIYLRNFHNLDGTDIPIGKHNDSSIRDIRYTESEDFVTWTEPKRIEFTDENELIQYYTNGITKYYRADFYFGIPTRYTDRVNDSVNFKHLPKLSGLREELIRRYGRSGTAVTDCTTIFSRDGHTFERSGEPFCTPGVENHENWIYGDCYFGRGLFETESDFPFEPCEMSIYKCHGYRHRAVDVVRYTIRLDGFRSWYAKGEGYALTTPVVLNGSSMTVNFATSALGYLRIIICDENGKELDGYDSTRLFGDSVERPVEFAKPLSALTDKCVRIKIEMSECNIFSLNIE